MRFSNLVVSSIICSLFLVPLVAGDWVQLFNGKDLEGWKHVGPGRVYVDDGLMKTEGGMGLLWYTREKVGNCTLRVVFKTTTRQDNSGVFIRIGKEPETPWDAVHSGYEVQILETWPEETHERSEHQKTSGDEWHMTGAIYSISKAEKQVQKAPGEWNTLDIVLDGPRTTVFLNGEQVTEYIEGSAVPPRQHDYEPIRGRRPDEGYIGIQNHHKPAEVHFREVSVKRD